MTLNNLGNVQANMNRFEAAVASTASVGRSPGHPKAVGRGAARRLPALRGHDAEQSGQRAEMT